MDEFNLRA